MIKKKCIGIIIFILFLSSLAFSQTVKLKINLEGGDKYIPAFMKNEVVYVSANELASALGINYYYSKTNQKTEYKFENYKLKFSAKNPFVIKTITGSKDEIIQLPLSTYLLNNTIFVPLDYILELIKNGYPNKLNFKKESLVLSVINAKKAAEKSTQEKPSAEKLPAKEETSTAETAGNDFISISEKANGTLVTFKLKKNKVKYDCSIKNNYIYITLKNELLKFDEVKNISPKSTIKEIKSKQQNGNTLIRLELNPSYDSHEASYGSDGKSILLTLRNKTFAKKNYSEKKEKWDFDVIVIDAGHGGKDIGAVGINGLKEKDVNLAVALKLGKLIENNLKGIKVVYTRKTDTFVELYKRGKIANEKNGKLFISIHCNSTPQKPSDASGTEIYLLRPGRTESAIKIAERENGVIKYEDNPSRYQKLTDENFILVSMAHSSYMKYSEKFSDYLNTNFLNNQQLKSRGVKQAGFYVLIGASMPGVLVESGFISNKNDAKILSSSNGQTRIATSIYEAVKKFKEYYDKVIESES